MLTCKAMYKFLGDGVHAEEPIHLLLTASSRVQTVPTDAVA